MEVPVPAIVMLIAFLILFFILKKTPLGRQTYAVGGNEKVSYISGIKIDRIKIFAYALTGCLCAIAGAILTARLNSAQPTAGMSWMLSQLSSWAVPRSQAAKAVFLARSSVLLSSVP